MLSSSIVLSNPARWLRFGAAFLATAAICAAQVTIAEFATPTAGSHPEMITLGPDGAFWFAEFSGNNIGRITTNGVITEYPVPTAAAGPLGIVAGPDGALWFTEFSAGKIGRMTTAGVVTNEYPLPHAGTSPRDMCLGPDGALWFLELGRSSIGRITTAGAITEYPVPFGGNAGITAGPDGAIWYGAQTLPSGSIGRLTTAGVFTNQYTIPAAWSYPVGITSGPDGNLWIGALGNTIGRMTTAGVFTAYAASGAVDEPVTGADGAIWFTESGRIGRVTMDGLVNEYPIPSGTNGLYITTGPSGTLWFTEYGASRIGVVVPNGVTVPTGSVAVPALSKWGVAILAVILMGLAALRLRQTGAGSH